MSHNVAHFGRNSVLRSIIFHLGTNDHARSGVCGGRPGWRRPFGARTGNKLACRPIFASVRAPTTETFARFTRFLTTRTDAKMMILNDLSSVGAGPGWAGHGGSGLGPAGRGDRSVTSECSGLLGCPARAVSDVGVVGVGAVD